MLEGLAKLLMIYGFLNSLMLVITVIKVDRVIRVVQIVSDIRVIEIFRASGINKVMSAIKQVQER